MSRLIPVLMLTCVAAAPAVAQNIYIDGVDCQRLTVNHVPAADVEYKPGVDAQGRKVAPADLNGGAQIKVPERITFDVAADLRRFGIPSTSPLFQPNVRLGQVTVERDGRAYYNGQPLQSPEVEALRELCRQRGGVKQR
jgi:hypothetical protein